MFIHTSDVHIGAFAGTPLRDSTIDAFREIARFAVDEGFKYLVVAGDLFEEPRIESYDTIINVSSILRELKDSGVKVICGLGSHDYAYSRRDLMSVYEATGLINVPKFTVEENKMVLHPLDTGDYVFYALPGLRNNYELEYLTSGRVVFKDLNNVHKPVILIAHTSVEFEGYRASDYSSRYGKVVLAESIFNKIPINKISYVALGHIHFPIPLAKEFRSRAAYPGAPVGRDVNDLRETIVLRNRFNVDRRFLVVEVDHDPPIVKSIWRGFNLEVIEVEIKFVNHSSFLNEVKSTISSLSNRGHRAVLINLPGRLEEIQSDIFREVLTIGRDNGVYIHIRTFDEKAIEKLVLNLDLSSNLRDLEIEAIKKFIQTKMPGLDVDKIAELLDKLGRSFEGRKEDFYRELFKEIEHILNEVVEKRG